MINDDKRLIHLEPFLPEDDRESWVTRLLYFFSLESFGKDTALAKAENLVEVQKFWTKKTLVLGERISEDVAETIPEHLKGMERGNDCIAKKEWFSSGIEQWSVTEYKKTSEAPIGSPAALGKKTFERFEPVPYSFSFLNHMNLDYRHEVHLPWVGSIVKTVNIYPELRETPFEKLNREFSKALFTLVEMGVKRIILGNEPGEDEEFWLDLFLKGTPYIGFADENIGKKLGVPDAPTDLPKFLYK